MKTLISIFRATPPSTISITALLSRPFIAVALAFSVAAVAHAETGSLSNGNFDSDLTGWDLSGTPPPTWNMADVTSNPDSGSVMLFNAEVQGNARVYPLRQCIAMPAPGIYAVEAAGILPAGHPGGRLVVSFVSRADADCSGSYTQSDGGYFLRSNGTWVHGTNNVTMTPGFMYLSVALGIEKDDGGSLLVGNIDAVHVIRDYIFSNGFEAAGLP